MQLHDKGHNSESYSFGVMSLLTYFLSRMMAPDRRAWVPHALVIIIIIIMYMKLHFIKCRKISGKGRSVNSNRTKHDLYK